MTNSIIIIAILLVLYYIFYQKARFNHVHAKMNKKYSNVVVIETSDTKDFYRTLLGYEKLGYTSVFSTKLYFVVNVCILVKQK